MNRTPEEDRHPIDRLADEIRNDRLDDETVEAARARVWARVAPELGLDAGSDAHHPLRGRSDYEALIGDYLAGRLSPARAALFEAYERENPDFRRQVDRERAGTPAPEPTGRPAHPRSAGGGILPRRWALAAAATAAAMIVGLLGIGIWGPGGTASDLPRLASATGPVQLVEGTGSRALTRGEAIPEGASVRTGREGGAFVRLPDGTLVELAPRTQLAVDAGFRGTTIDLDRGRVIVEAAKQRRGRLYVATDDSMISVTGTVFAVNTGHKGSRVTVLEGEVRVEHGGAVKVLRPGQQTATSPRLQPTDIRDEVAWSGKVEDRLALLNELMDLGQEVEEILVDGSPRHASRLLDLTPDDALIYAALPNVTRNLRDAYDRFTAGVEASPLLSKWIQAEQPQDENIRRVIEQVIDGFDELGHYLGDEIVATVSPALEGAGGEPDVLLIATTGNSDQLRAFLDARLEQIASARDQEGDVPVIRWLEQAAPDDDAQSASLWIWVGSGIVGMSDDAARLADLALRLEAEATPEPTPLRRRVARAYDEGVEFLVAVDVERITALAAEGVAEGEALTQARGVYRLLGIDNLQTVVTERKSLPTGTMNRAAIEFAGERRGIASFLAEPGPIGALDLLSPETSAAVAFTLREPRDITREFVSLMGDLSPEFGEQLARVESEHGVRLVDDLAAPLGGDIAIALDGPMMPVPSWKLVMEVYDPSRLQQTIAVLVERIDATIREHVPDAPRIVLEPADVRGREAWVLRLADQGAVVSYTYVDGYLLATPTPGLLERALRYHDAGARLVDSPRFEELLPRDGHVHVSGLFFQDLGKQVAGLADMAESAAGTDEEKRQMIQGMAAMLEPMMFVAYAEAEEITLTTTTPSDSPSPGVAQSVSMLRRFERGSLADLLRSASGGHSLEVR